MAAAGEFESWLNSRLDSLEVDRDVYGSYILGVLQEEDSEEEEMDAIQSILSAFLEEDALEDVCKEIIKQWSDSSSGSKAKNNHGDVEVQAIASLIEKQAQIVVKQKEVSEGEKKSKAALLAQYASITDDEACGHVCLLLSVTHSFNSESALFKNTNLEDVINAKKVDREKAREDSHKKKEQDKMQREKDKLVKQERKDKEKKRTQKGERKR
ncbi:CCD43 protein, partial [Polyodon spathula]|nr:CCD43 protein [Polyodon spathula]